MSTCSNPGCSEPGINKCSLCKITPYCGPICQTADWPGHREECPGHLRKMGMAHFEKARGFNRARNFEQTFRFSELALTKLKQLKDRSLAFIETLDEALLLKFNALDCMGRAKETLEIATERYNMWAATFMRHRGMINAAFPLIESLIVNKEYAQAHLIASTVHGMTMHPTNHDIPESDQQPYLAQSSRIFALATLRLAETGGIPEEEQQNEGKKAIALARKALAINTQLFGADSGYVACDMIALASSLDYFNDVDDEAIHLIEQAIGIHSRVQGSSSFRVAAEKDNLSRRYIKRANDAGDARDLDRQLANLELALSRRREALRIFRALNHVDKTAESAQVVAHVEEAIRNVRIKIAATTAIATAAPPPPPATTTTSS